MVSRDSQQEIYLFYRAPPRVTVLTVVTYHIKGERVPYPTLLNNDTAEQLKNGSREFDQLHHERARDCRS